MSYANKLRVRSNKHAQEFIQLNTSIKDFKKLAEIDGAPLDFESIGHRIVNLAYEQLIRESRRSLQPFNPRWSTVFNIREEIAGKLNEHFTGIQGRTNQSTQRIVEPNL
jgi:hypothetical protein